MISCRTIRSKTIVAQCATVDDRQRVHVHRIKCDLVENKNTRKYKKDVSRRVIQFANYKSSPDYSRAVPPSSIRRSEQLRAEPHSTYVQFNGRWKGEGRSKVWSIYAHMYNKQKRVKKKKKNPAWHGIKDVLMSTNAEICINKRAPTLYAVSRLLSVVRRRGWARETLFKLRAQRMGACNVHVKKIAFLS